MSRFSAVVAVLTATLWIGSPAVADQNDPRLDSYFELLKSAAPDSAEAFVAEREIWRIWHEAPSASGRVLMEQGIDMMQSGDIGGALTVFDALIALEPDFAEAWNKRATVYYLGGDFPDSLSDIEHALKLEPRHFGAQSGEGLVFDAMGNPDAAIAAFEGSLAINPHQPGIAARLEQLKVEREGRQL